MKANVDEDTGRALDDEIIEGVRRHRGTAGYSDEFIDVFDFPQAELDEGYWAFCPPEENAILQKLEGQRDAALSAVVDSAFAGTQTSANDVFIVIPVDADRVEADETGEEITVVPAGEDREYEIETDLLKPWLQGRDIERWRGDWSGQHVISPYQKGANGNVHLVPGSELQDELPLTWEYLEEHRNELESRQGGRFEGRDDWYGFGYPKSMNRFEKPKLVGAEIASEATFMLDEQGTWYFKTGYGIQLASEHRDRTKEFAALLNSKVADFCLKHISSIKAGGYYKYTTHYLEELPILWNDSSNNSEMTDSIDRIVTAMDKDNRTRRFPEAYLGAYDGELDHIDYEWQTRRYPVDAAIQEKTDGRLAVTAGRSDEITDPLLDAGDREENRLRARYVHAAVDGRNVKSGEETTIPIPSQRDGVAELMAALADDEETVAETDIAELEAAIDTAVYDLFELTENERAVIEEYLEVF